MQRIYVVALLACVPSLAQFNDPLRHLFQTEGRLTPPSSLPAREIGRDFLRQSAPLSQLDAAVAEAAYVAREYLSSHNGITHLSYRQQFDGIEVDNAEWVVNIDSAGQVVNAGGSLARRPRPGVLAPDSVAAMRTVRTAVGAVDGSLAARFTPMESGPRPRQGMRFAGSSFPADIEGIPVWYNVNGDLRAAWKFAVPDAGGFTRFAVVVDILTRKVLSKRKMTYFQAPARGLVYDLGSPQPNPKPGVALTAPPATVQRALRPFTGDPVASPRGWVSGTETVGNNVVSGSNPRGSLCSASLNCVTRPITATAADRNFSFPIDLAANPTSYPEASTVNAFYWANQTHDWFYALGFDEAAGNFQQDNFGHGGIGGDPMFTYSLYASAASRQASLNNSFYSTTLGGADGSQPFLAFFLETADGLFYDNSLDAPTVVHEYTHGVSDRLVRALQATEQGGAMAEAWSDFFAIEFLTPEGAPPDGVYPFSEYPDQLFGIGIRSRPYSTKTDVNPLTFANYGHVFFAPEVHYDGEIWFEALWELRANLIQQFGEKEGRRRARQLVIDGMKLSPPAPSMIDMRDAILLADQVDFKGASQTQLWAGFAKRGFGALAYASDGDSIHVHASFDVPSPKGSVALLEDRFLIGEPVRIVLQDSNLTANSVVVQVLGGSGDRENVVLRRRGPVYAGIVSTDFGPVALGDATLEVIPGDFITVFYNDSDAPGGPSLAQATAPVSVDYDVTFRPNTPLRFTGERSLGLSFTPARPLTLPWAFPYFGRLYTQVWVQNNGILTFDYPALTACTDTFSLAVTNGIAPLWMNLATDGGAQAGEDVYVSSGPDSVTFRWVAETQPDFIGSQPEAVNFAATLFKDGRIVFQYGAGNRNLTGGSNFFGCAASTPTVGISNGHETFVTLVPTHDGKGTLENAAQVVLDPPFNPSSAPSVRLESPAAGDRAQGVLSGQGIAWDPDPESAIRGIDVLVDGIAMTAAATGFPRPDFCADQPVQGCPNVGFTFQVPLARFQVKPGSHTLQLRTTNRRGYFVDTPSQPLSFTVDAGEPHTPVAVIEAPLANQEVSGDLAVRGYAYSDLFRVSAVDVLIDGVTFGPASYATTRNDICGALTPLPPNCPRIGFSFTISSRNLTNGPHSIAVRVADETGRYNNPTQPVEFTVRNANTDPPVAVITEPRANQTLSGSARISGYAYAPSGTVRNVILIVDGGVAYSAQYGAARPVECAALSGVRACPNIGFDVTLDTRGLVDGPHFIQVEVQDNIGNFVVTPRSLAGGLNVFVKN